MSPRRTRIEKVITVREKELDQRVAKLADSRAAEQRALSLEEQKRRELEEASSSRLKLAEEGEALSASSWIEANEWLQSRQKHLDQARQAATKAEVETRKAQTAVLAARTDLKKVELLSERIQLQEQGEANKLERRLEDEFASFRFFRGDTDK